MSIWVVFVSFSIFNSSPNGEAEAVPGEGVIDNLTRSIQMDLSSLRLSAIPLGSRSIILKATSVSVIQACKSLGILYSLGILLYLLLKRQSKQAFIGL